MSQKRVRILNGRTEGLMKEYRFYPSKDNGKDDETDSLLGSYALYVASLCFMSLLTTIIA